MLKKWKRLDSNIIFRHSRLVLAEDTVELPDGTQTKYLKFIEGTPGVTIICIDGHKVLLQKEYSYPPDEILYQFPGGKVEKGENPKDGAIRELAEECSLKANNIKELGSFYMDNRRSDQRAHVFLATELETANGQPDIEENIENIWLNIEDVDCFIRENRIENWSLLAAWAFFKAKS